MVRRRHVYHVAGYDPIDAGAQYRRFARQLEVFRRTWNVDASVSELTHDNEQSRAWWSVRAGGPNWQVEAGHEILLWDDIVRGDFTRSLPLRLFKALCAYLDFIVTGTMFRYILANQRYAIFFLFPILSVVLFAVIGWLFARLLTGFIGLDVIVRALARDAGFARRGAAVCVLTIGATIPKFALHPRAQTIRARIARVVNEPSIAWTEYQSRADTISFYKFDPVSLRRIDDDRLDGKPVIRRVQIHDMLLPETFERCRTHVLRLHYRSVMANDRRAPYDYFLMACGPVSFADWTRSPLGFLDFLAADGTYRDPAPSRV